MAEALIDAAILYGSQRYFDGLHRTAGWKFSGSYREDDDRLLFLELLHHLLVYDCIVMDNSSAEQEAASDLIRFVDMLNAMQGREAVSFRNIGTGAVDSDPSKHYFCVLLKEIIRSTPIIAEDLGKVKVPWAYHDPLHHDRGYFKAKFDQLKLPEHLISFAIFVWRALTYGEIALHKVKNSEIQMSYVAAPGRLAALKSVLDHRDMKRYQLSRDLLREVRWGLPGFPSGGFDFTHLHSLPFFATSPLSAQLFNSEPSEALRRVCSIHSSSEALKLRQDWRDILFNSSNYAAVGGVNIMIMRDVQASGPITQNQFIRAVPNDSENAEAA